jgi:hypothetical protein
MTRGTVGLSIREAPRGELADALLQSRSDTLATFAVFESALAGAGWAVPQRAEINPPLWELGHVGWFQSYWVARNPERHRGSAADPDAARTPCLPADGDTWYDSSRVPHAARASLQLPDADTTRSHLQAQLDQTLALLTEHDAAADDAADDTSLYFWRLVLLHEDMHHEAALYTAQNLGLPISDPRWQPAPASTAREALAFDAGRWRLGHDAPGFAFDNELDAHEVSVPAGRIDSRVVTWAEYLPFVDAGGYADPRWWSDDGRRWLAATGTVGPRYLRRDGATSQKPCQGQWQQQRWGRWQPLDPTLPACHLSAHEAEAWCAWAGRGGMGTCRRPAARCVRLGQRVGMDREPLHAVPGLRRAPVPRLFGPVVRQPQRAARRVVRHAATFAAPALSQLLLPRAQRHLCRLSIVCALKHATSVPMRAAAVEPRSSTAFSEFCPC